MNAHKPNTSLGRCKTAAIGLLLVVLPFCAGAMEPSTTSLTSQYFRLQYNKPDLSFCNSSVCVDFDGDGKRELLFASRKTKRLEMLNASDGAVLWSRKFDGACSQADRARPCFSVSDDKCVTVSVAQVPEFLNVLFDLQF